MKKIDEKPILTAFCFTDIHVQQSMLDYPVTLRKSFLIAAENAVKEFGKADITVMGGDNVSDYPYWNKSCALPKKNFIDLKQKLQAVAEKTAKGGKVFYVAGNNDFMLGDIGTAENEPYNTTDFYDCIERAFGAFPENEKLEVKSKYKPKERYWDAFHTVVNGVDFIGVNINPDTAYNTHDGYYTEEALTWVKNKLNEIDPDGVKPVFIVGHLSALYYFDGTELKETLPKNKELFFDVFKNHKNAFYLYGHEHGESAAYKNYTSAAVLHVDKNNMPLDNNVGQNDNVGKEYSFSLVHMGGLRPFNAENFANDGIVGFGGLPEKQYYPSTGTPLLAQYLVIEVYADKAVFFMRNAGSKTGYDAGDRLLPYTVFFRK